MREAGWIHRRRWPLSALAGVAVLLFVGGLPGAILAPVAAVGCWLGIARVEPAGVRRECEQAARDLPHLVRLLGAGLASGAAPAQALEAVTEAAPGVASARLAGAAARLRLGVDPADVWSEVARSPSLGPLGRAVARAHGSGAPVAVAVGRLADELARTARSDVESRARSVGVKAAVPLGVCLLPSFLLLGVVPLAAGLLTSLRW